MPDEEPKETVATFLAQSMRQMQENLRRAGPAVAAGYTLAGAIFLLGGIGYAADRWLDSAPWCLLAGLLLGLIVGFVELAKIVWRK